LSLLPGGIITETIEAMCQMVVSIL
jgi:hypothetical protein